MTFQLISTPQFERRLRRFIRSHPELKDKIAQTFEDLNDDPFQPHLWLHPLRGQLEGLYAVRITYQYRMTLMIQITERNITLISIGTHDEVYRR